MIALTQGEIQAQQGTITTGGEASGSDGYASFSVGLIDYFIASGSDLMTTEGIQQPYELAVAQEEIERDITLFKNITSDFVILNIQNYSIENMHYELYDLHGKLIVKQKIIGGKTHISLNEFSNAIYFVTVYNKNKQKVKTFKIIKE